MDLEAAFMKGSGAPSAVGIVTGAPVKELSRSTAPSSQPPAPATRSSRPEVAGIPGRRAGRGGARVGGHLQIENHIRRRLAA